MTIASRMLARTISTVLLAGAAFGCAYPSRGAPGPAAGGPEYVFALSGLSRPPVLANRDRFECLVRAYYPRTLALYGSRGTAVVLLTVDPDGRVFDAAIQSTSGLPSLDQAALQIARGLRFTPGEFRRRRVWTQFATALVLEPPSAEPRSASPALQGC